MSSPKLNVRKATDIATAQKVIEAVELAESGAGAPLIQRLTGFGARWSRRIRQDNKKARARRLGEPLQWVLQNSDRVLHAELLILIHQIQPRESEVRRLLDAFHSYRAVVGSPVIDLDRAAQILTLFQPGEIPVRSCSKCPSPHLMFAANLQCPLCRFIARTARDSALT